MSSKGVTSIAVALFEPDPDQPRRHFDESELLALGQNLLKHGQQVPVIAYASGDRFVILDGERRFRAAKLAGLESLSAIVVPAKPPAADLHVLRMSIDVHKVSHSAVERADLIARIQADTSWSVVQIAEQLGMKQPVITKLLAFNQKLCPAVRDLLHRGELDMEKAYAITQEADPAKQLALAKQAQTLTREELRQRVKSQPVASAKAVAASAVQLCMPGGMLVAVKGRDLTLACVIDVLTETVKQLKKARDQGLDITTQMRVMRDTAKRLPKSALST